FWKNNRMTYSKSRSIQSSQARGTQVDLPCDSPGSKRLGATKMSIPSTRSITRGNSPRNTQIRWSMLAAVRDQLPARYGMIDDDGEAVSSTETQCVGADGDGADFTMTVSTRSRRKRRRLA